MVCVSDVVGQSILDCGVSTSCSGNIVWLPGAVGKGGCRSGRGRDRGFVLCHRTEGGDGRAAPGYCLPLEKKRSGKQKETGKGRDRGRKKGKERWV